MLRTGSKNIIVNAFGGSGPEFSDNPVEQSENARKASREAIGVATLHGQPGQLSSLVDKYSREARAATNKTYPDMRWGTLESKPHEAAQEANNQSSHWQAQDYHLTKAEGEHRTAGILHHKAWQAHAQLNAINAKTKEQHEQAEDFHERMSNDFTGKGTPQKHLQAAAHHATAAHVLERHGYNSSDDAAADREF